MLRVCYACDIGHWSAIKTSSPKINKLERPLQNVSKLTNKAIFGSFAIQKLCGLYIFGYLLCAKHCSRHWRYITGNKINQVLLSNTVLSIEMDTQLQSKTKQNAQCIKEMISVLKAGLGNAGAGDGGAVSCRVVRRGLSGQKLGLGAERSSGRGNSECRGRGTNTKMCNHTQSKCSISTCVHNHIL